MKKTKLILFCLFCCCNTSIMAQYRTQVLQHDIRTLRVRYADLTLPLQRPYLELIDGVVDGQDEQNCLEISFDQLSHDTQQYSYKVIHLNHDWMPSDISSYEYVDGFTSADIIDYELSLNTQQVYTHYWFTFPNDEMQLTASGNYVLQVYQDGDEEKVVAQVCFSVVEPMVDIDVQLRTNTDIELNGRYQQLDIDVNTTSLSVRDAQDIKIAVQQNGRWDNRVVLTKPTFVEPHRLRYINQRPLIFEGGNEFRHFDTYSTYYAGYNVDIVDYAQGEYHAVLLEDEVRGTMGRGAGREGTSYLTEKDANGQMVVNCEKTDYVDSEAEYMWVHFCLPVAQPIMDARVFVGGDLFYNQYTAANMMYYDAEKKCYRARAFLKQGGYNYMYYTVKTTDALQTRDSRVQVSCLPLEGSHWQTQNEYVVEVYYRPFGARYDRLVGRRGD